MDKVEKTLSAAQAFEHLLISEGNAVAHETFDDAEFFINQNCDIFDQDGVKVYFNDEVKDNGWHDGWYIMEFESEDAKGCPEREMTLEEAIELTGEYPKGKGAPDPERDYKIKSLLKLKYSYEQIMRALKCNSGHISRVKKEMNN